MAVDLDKYVQARRRKRKFINIFRWFLILVLCLVLVFIEAGRFLRKAAVEKIAEITNTHVEVKSLNFNMNGSVDIKNLIIKPTELSAYDNAILNAEKASVHFDKYSLLKLKPELQKIVIEDFAVNACYDMNQESWNLEALKFPGKGKGGLKEINLEDGKLNVSTVDNNRIENIAIISFDADLHYSEGGYIFSATGASSQQLGKSSLAGKWLEGRLISSFDISSAKLSVFGRQWDINNVNGNITCESRQVGTVRLVAESLVCKEETLTEKSPLESLFGGEKFQPYTALQKFFDRFRPFGKIGIEIDVNGSLEQIDKSSLTGKVFCKDVTVCYHKFPYLIKELSGQIDLTERRASFKDMKGCHGDVKLSFDGWSEGFGQDWKYGLRIRSSNMALDDDLYNALNERNKKFWSDFSPTGKITVDYTASRQGPDDKKSSLIVGLPGVKARYCDFPYPLENIKGMLAFDASGVSLSKVSSSYDGREIIINGNILTEEKEKTAFDIAVDFKNIPLDSVLAEALPDKQREIYEKYDFKGLIDGQAKVKKGGESSRYIGQSNEIRDTNDEIPDTSYEIDVRFRNTSLQMNPLPVHVADACGEAFITQDSPQDACWRININSFKGKYGQGQVSLGGKITTSGLLDISLDANQINVDKNLFNPDKSPILSGEKIGTFATEAELEGKINLSVFLTRDCPNCPVDYKASVQCLDNSMNPAIFPFPLTNIKGNLTITKEAVEFSEITARIDSAKPAKAATLNPEKKGDTNPDWSGLLPILSGFIRGAELRTKGLYEISKGLKHGEFEFSAEDIKVKGQSYGTETKFSGQLCDGDMMGEFELVQRDSESSRCPDVSGQNRGYQLELGFSSVNLKKLLTRYIVVQKGQADNNEISSPDKQHQDISGILNGSLEIGGQIDNSRSNTGRCKLQIADMQVGKITPLGKLVSVLKLTEPQDYTFNEMFINSYIDGDKLTFEKFDLSGENIAFSGTGSMNLKDHNIDLVLTVRGARLATADPSFFGSLGDSVGRAVLRMEVTGNAFDPQVQIKPLPVIKESLEILGTKRK